jgi:hypothetical protein
MQTPHRTMPAASARRLATLFAFAAAAIGGIAKAQVLYLEPIDAGSEDVNSLRISLHEPRADLRVPVDFERVYRVRGDSKLLGSGTEEMYARVSNGLVAMFPKSTYVASSARYPTLPPGTIWLLGASTHVGAAPRSSEGAQSYVMPIDLRVKNEVPTKRAELPPMPVKAEMNEAIPCLFESEAVRRERVGLRLNEAMR